MGHQGKLGEGGGQVKVVWVSSRPRGGAPAGVKVNEIGEDSADFSSVAWFGLGHVWGEQGERLGCHGNTRGCQGAGAPGCGVGKGQGWCPWGSSPRSPRGLSVWFQAAVSHMGLLAFCPFLLVLVLPGGSRADLEKQRVDSGLEICILPLRPSPPSCSYLAGPESARTREEGQRQHKGEGGDGGERTEGSSGCD